MAKQTLVIFPFNGNGIEALDAIDYEQFDFIGFIDDNAINKKSQWPLLTRTILDEDPSIKVLAVPGSPASFLKRAEVIDSLQLNVSRFVSVIHPKATVGLNVKVGYNCLILAGAVLTSNAQIGNHVCILPNSVVHHDAVIDDHVLIGSNVAIAGSTHIGKNCYIGSGSNIINNVEISPYTLVGIGSNVIHSIKAAPNSKWVGNPARKLN